MFRLFTTVRDLRRDGSILRDGRYGVIEMADERLAAIHLRPWPKLVSIWEARLGGQLFHGKAAGNRCWLYYNQPWSCPGFLALKYIVSSAQTTIRTLRGALIVLDEIARLKKTAAIVCHVNNRRISDRLLTRWGWESHFPQARGRHFIKRFYGEYPDPTDAWLLCGMENRSLQPVAADGCPVV